VLDGEVVASDADGFCATKRGKVYCVGVKLAA